ncbi:MAG: ABC transporter substrate-binding protein [Pseudonocardia sp.]|nr:ABC transporter substrate-binding protein [Pseudonocardia sp.]
MPNLQRLPDRFFTDGAAVTGVNVLGIGYNTTEVQNPPKTSEDALAPEYRGKILLGDPRNAPSYVGAAVVTIPRPVSSRLIATASFRSAGGVPFSW